MRHAMFSFLMASTLPSFASAVDTVHVLFGSFFTCSSAFQDDALVKTAVNLLVQSTLPSERQQSRTQQALAGQHARFACDASAQLTGGMKRLQGWQANLHDPPGLLMQAALQG
eukprot:TRINITY_DN41977_c0_g1_i2.p2 TRINITY_DN41977_c0_g1~~TRINITY_DN41977_c0_g1_i2.p2  ORF type:complete len:113 (+),score=11.84 TRINITY_DN41977_c0_g1_i2:750-1088(+)